MKYEDQEKFISLYAQATQEKDPMKLTELVADIARMLEQEERCRSGIACSPWRLRLRTLRFVREQFFLAAVAHAGCSS